MFKVIDPLTHVRAHPEIYCSGGVPDPRFFANRVASDALTLGASRTLSARVGDWWAVAADVDWLARADRPVRELFHSVVAFPERHVNDCRSEIILTAFAEHVGTYADHGPVEVIKGRADDWDPASSSLAGDWARVIVFSMRPVPVRSAAAEAMAPVGK
jgi:hypothetical protein